MQRGPAVPSFSIRRTALSATLAAAVVVPLAAAVPADAYAAQVRVDLRVLVVTDGRCCVDTIVAQLDREGVPYDTVNVADAGRTPITAATLEDQVGTVTRGRYQGIVVPNESALPAGEMAVVEAYEEKFGVRQVDAYTWAGANVGLSAVYSGPIDGTDLTVESAARDAGFGYLAGTVRVDDRNPSINETYAYLGIPTAIAPASFTPLITGSKDGASGSVLGVYRSGGREELVGTLAANRYQTHATILMHGVVSWLTHGVHLGYWRNWFSVHVDDIFLTDARWNAPNNCTAGDGCPGTGATPLIRIVPADVDFLADWQRRTGLKLDLAFNGGASVRAGSDDALTATFVAEQADFRWLNHTYSHPYLGCVRDFTVVPWQCAADADGNTEWFSQERIAKEITDNVTWAMDKGIALDPTELVTGEHSGLKTLPQMPTDNPYLAPALAAAGIQVVASDGSRESTSRLIGPARTVPRHPINIFYNVGTKAEEVDEYNWIYTSKADGGSGVCEGNTTSTCIAPLSTSTGFDDYIAPLEARFAFDRLVAADPAPHYVHQSNLTEDRVVYPVLDAVVNRYRSTFTTDTPIVNPRMADVSILESRQAAWRTAVQNRTVEAYLQDGIVTVVNNGTAAVDVPLTAPNDSVNLEATPDPRIRQGGYGEPYGTERSAWTTLETGGQLLVTTP
jgi:hypothetical protein